MLSTSYLRLTERAAPLFVRPGLFHRTKRPFLIGIVEPSPLPEITGRGLGRHFGAPVAVQRDPIDRAGDMNPVGHDTPIRPNPRRLPLQKHDRIGCHIPTLTTIRAPWEEPRRQ
jgi:hypothetical protein